MSRDRKGTVTPPGRFATVLRTPIEGREGGEVAAASKSSNVRAKTQAKRLRKTLTGPEAKLWAHLKEIQTVHTHFRKQVPIGPYVADFACLRGRLVVEVDGFQHAFASEHRRDQKRTAFLEGQGFRVLRFWNEEVLKEMDAVLNAIYAHLYGGVNAPVVSMSRRRSGGQAPYSTSTGRAIASGPEVFEAPHPPRFARHPPHRGEGGAPSSPPSSPSMGEVARRAGGGEKSTYDCPASMGEVPSASEAEAVVSNPGDRSA